MRNRVLPCSPAWPGTPNLPFSILSAGIEATEQYTAVSSLEDLKKNGFSSLAWTLKYEDLVNNSFPIPVIVCIYPPVACFHTVNCSPLAFSELPVSCFEPSGWFSRCSSAWYKMFLSSPFTSFLFPSWLLFSFFCYWFLIGWLWGQATLARWQAIWSLLQFVAS